MEACLKLHLDTIDLKAAPKKHALEVEVRRTEQAAPPPEQTDVSSNSAQTAKADTAAATSAAAPALPAAPKSPADFGRPSAASGAGPKGSTSGSVPAQVVAKPTGRRGAPVPAVTSSASNGTAAGKGTRPASSSPKVQANGPASVLASSQPVSALRLPKTSTDFEATWRSLGSDTALRQQYLSMIDPSQLPSIFKSSLTPQLLQAVVVTLAERLNASFAPSDASLAHHCVAMLDALTSVPRFSMTVMCIPSKERKALSEQMQSAHLRLCSAAPAAAEELTPVHRKYKLV